MLKLVLIDNYDSFTYNLYDYFLQLGVDCEVIRNDMVDLAQLAEYPPDGLVLSPGPQRPQQAGQLMQVIAQFYHQLPILGICLGHQALGEYFGARLCKAPAPVHGKTSLVRHREQGVFAGLPNPLEVMRYHSLLLRDLPPELEGLAYTAEGSLMAMRHKKLPLWGIQFHPESILTQAGLPLLNNWLQTLKST